MEEGAAQSRQKEGNSHDGPDNKHHDPFTSENGTRTRTRIKKKIVIVITMLIMMINNYKPPSPARVCTGKERETSKPKKPDTKKEPKRKGQVDEMVEVVEAVEVEVNMMIVRFMN